MWRALTSLSFLVEVGDIGLTRPRALGNLYENTLIQLEFVAILDLIVGSPVMVTNEVSIFIVDHYALVKLVVP
jgi:hypothetical protein